MLNKNTCRIPHHVSMLTKFFISEEMRMLMSSLQFCGFSSCGPWKLLEGLLRYWKLPGLRYQIFWGWFLCTIKSENNGSGPHYWMDSGRRMCVLRKNLKNINMSVYQRAWWCCCVYVFMWELRQGCRFWFCVTKPFNFISKGALATLYNFQVGFSSWIIIFSRHRHILSILWANRGGLSAFLNML